MFLSLPDDASTPLKILAIIVDAVVVGASSAAGTWFGMMSAFGESQSQMDSLSAAIAELLKTMP